MDEVIKELEDFAHNKKFIGISNNLLTNKHEDFIKDILHVAISNKHDSNNVKRDNRCILIVHGDEKNVSSIEEIDSNKCVSLKVLYENNLITIDNVSLGTYPENSIIRGTINNQKVKMIFCNSEKSFDTSQYPNFGFLKLGDKVFYPILDDENYKIIRRAFLEKMVEDFYADDKNVEILDELKNELFVRLIEFWGLFGTPFEQLPIYLINNLNENWKDNPKLTSYENATVDNIYTVNPVKGFLVSGKLHATGEFGKFGNHYKPLKSIVSRIFRGIMKNVNLDKKVSNELFQEFFLDLTRNYSELIRENLTIPYFFNKLRSMGKKDKNINLFNILLFRKFYNSYFSEKYQETIPSIFYELTENNLSESRIDELTYKVHMLFERIHELYKIFKYDHINLGELCYTFRFVVSDIKYYDMFNKFFNDFPNALKSIKLVLIRRINKLKINMDSIVTVEDKIEMEHLNEQMIQLDTCVDYLIFIKKKLDHYNNKYHSLKMIE